MNEPDPPPRAPSGEALLLTVLTCGALLPFAWKAFTIDDPLFVWCAQQIARHPLDPYGFRVNWFGVDMPMWEVMRNPPLGPYYLAAAGSLLGWSELSLHAAMMLPAAACVLGTAALARHFGATGWFAGLLLLTFPVFFVSATSVMCDVLMLALLTWSAYAWVTGTDRQARARLLASGGLLAAAVLTKFTALFILPAFLLYARRHMRGPQLAALALPLVALGGYLVAARGLYGGSLIDALALASAGADAPGMLTRLEVFLTFLGGSFLTLLAIAPLAWPRRPLLVGCASFVLIAAVVFGTGWLRDLTLQRISLAGLPAAAHAVVFTAAGIVALVTCVTIWRAARGAAWLLVTWIAATMIFAVFGAWTMSGRYLLPLAPALAAGAAVIAGQRRRSGAPAAGPVLALIVSGAVSLTVAHGDAALADSARSAAKGIFETFGPNLWFQGHWGFQYYMEERAGRPLDAQASLVSTGEMIVVPENNANVFPLDRKRLQLKEKRQFWIYSPVSTMNRESGAGFYASVWGPFPYTAGVISPEKYYILSIVSP